MPTSPHRMLLWRPSAAAVLAVLVLGGCGSTSDESSSAGSAAESSPASSSADASSAPSESASAPSEDSEETDSGAAPTGSVEGDGYTLVVPEGWTDLSDQAEQVPQLALADLAYGDTSEEAFASNLNTIVTPANGETVDDAGVREQLATQVEEAIGVRPTTLDDVELDGEKAIGQMATVKKEGATLVQYVAVHEDNAYTLTVTLSEDRADESDSIVGGVVDSWRWQ